MFTDAVRFARWVSRPGGAALNPMNSKHRLTRAIGLFGAAFVFAADVISAQADGLTFDAAGSEASFLFTLKFDAEGNSEIVKTQQMSDKEVKRLTNKFEGF